MRPRPRRRSRLALTLVEREEISRGVIHGDSVRVIAASLGRAPFTVSREVARNGGIGQYRAAASEKRVWVQALRSKLYKLATQPPLRRLVARFLRRNGSPQQIAGWLKRNHPDEEAFWVSHETIYRSLFVQARGVLKKELIELCARTARSAARGTQSPRRTCAGGYRIRYRSANGRPRQRIGRYRGTGKGTCCAGARTATWSRWRSVRHAI
jgi:IS30 family transposase